MEETLNESITEPTSASSAGTENGENPFAGGGNSTGFGNPLAPDEGYEFDYSNTAGAGESGMKSPWDELLQFEEFNNVGDILGDVGGNPFAGDEGAETDNPFASGGTPSENVPPSTDGDTQSNIGGDSVPEGNNPPNSSNPNDMRNETADDVGEMSGEGGSMMNADFSGIDNGNNNTDNGNGNNFEGDDNIADGNGNWSFGDGNQVSGNGNWNLNEEDSSPFNSTFEGENNPLTGGNPLGVGEEGGIPADAAGNNPVFAGGSTTPTPVGEGEIPDTAENPTGNQNTVNGNGNWNFGSDNDTSGNGNWNFGDGNVVTDGNGNWNLGDNNEVSGNGNRPSGNDNSISGNSNRVTGDSNSINGNRFNVDEDDSNILGNADRYIQTDTDGSVSLVSDESKSDSNYNFDGVVEASADGELPESEDTTDRDIMNQVYGSLDSDSAGYLTGSNDAASSDSAGGNPFSGDAGGFGGGQMDSSSFGGDAASSDSAGGNPFSGGAGGFSGGQMGGGSFGGGAGSSDSASGNPFSGGAGDFGGGQMGGGSFGGSEESAPMMGGSTEQETTDANYTYDFSSFEDTQEEGGNPFGGDAPMMDGSEEGAPMMGGGAEQNTADANSTEDAQQGGSDLNELLRASPFGVLLDIPGVNGAEDIFGNIGGGASGFGGGDAASSDSAGGNPFSSGAGGFGGGQMGGSSFGGGSVPSGGDTSNENNGILAMSGFSEDASSGNPFANFNLLVVGDEANISLDDTSSSGNDAESEYDFSSFEDTQEDGGNPSSGDAPMMEESEDGAPAMDDSQGDTSSSSDDAESEYDFSSFEDTQEDGGNPSSGDAPMMEESEGEDGAPAMDDSQGDTSSSSDDAESEYDFSSFEDTQEDGGNPFSGDAPMMEESEGEDGASAMDDSQASAGGFDGAASNGSPFANFNLFVVGDRPNISIGSAGGFGGGQMSSSSFGGGAGSSDSASGNPFSGDAGGFGGSEESASMMGGSTEQETTDANYTYDFSSFEDAQDGGNPLGGGQMDSSSFGGDAASSDSAGGNPFSGGAGGFGGGQMGGGSFGGGAGSSDSASGNPFSGGAGGFGGGQMGGGSFGGSEESAPMMGGSTDQETADANSTEDAQQGGSDLNELLRSSPFGVLLDIPGVNGAEDIFGNIGGSQGGAQGENDGAPVMGGSQGGAQGGNPFANFNPLEDGNPFIEGDEPDVSFGGAGGFGGAQNENNAAGASENPLGEASSELPDEGPFAIGDADEYLVRDENGEWFISDDDVKSEDDTSLTNLEIPDVDSEASENPDEYNLEGAPDSFDLPETDEMSGEMPEEMLDLSGDMSEETDSESSGAYFWDIGTVEGASDAGTEDVSVELNDNGELEIPGFGSVNLLNKDGDTDPLIGNFADADGIGFGNENFDISEASEDGDLESDTMAIQFENGKLQIPGIGEIEIFDGEGNYALGVDSFGGPQLGEDSGLQFDGIEIPMDSAADDGTVI